MNELGWTALLEAVILGEGDRAHTEIVRVLVDGGVDTTIRDREGNTALDIAEDRGYGGMVRILQGRAVTTQAAPSTAGSAPGPARLRGHRPRVDARAPGVFAAPQPGRAGGGHTRC